MAEPMLSVYNINVWYGAIHAIKDISFNVNEGEIVALIGANGAGKSTTLKTVSGLLRSKTGSIKFMGEDITHTPADKLVGKGLAQVPEGRRAFLQMTVEENLEMGAFSLKDQSSLGKDLEMVFDYFPRLKERLRQLAGTLSGGELQRVLMALALEPLPQILILDEPLSGVDVGGEHLLMDMLDEIRQTYDLSILFSTHDFSTLQQYADKVILLKSTILKTGTPAEVLTSPEFRSVFHLDLGLHPNGEGGAAQ